MNNIEIKNARIILKDVYLILILYLASVKQKKLYLNFFPKNRNQ